MRDTRFSPNLGHRVWSFPTKEERARSSWIKRRRGCDFCTSRLQRHNPVGVVSQAVRDIAVFLNELRLTRYWSIYFHLLCNSCCLVFLNFKQNNLGKLIEILDRHDPCYSWHFHLVTSVKGICPFSRREGEIPSQNKEGGRDIFPNNKWFLPCIEIVLITCSLTCRLDLASIEAVTAKKAVEMEVPDAEKKTQKLKNTNSSLHKDLEEVKKDRDDAKL